MKIMELPGKMKIQDGRVNELETAIPRLVQSVLMRARCHRYRVGRLGALMDPGLRIYFKEQAVGALLVMSLPTFGWMIGKV
jgi:hypothetical protein